MRRWLWRRLMRFLRRAELGETRLEARVTAAAAHDQRAQRKADRVLQRHNEIVATYRAADGRLDSRR